VRHAARIFAAGWARAFRRAVVASLASVCLHAGGVGAASDGHDPCAGAAPALRKAADALDEGLWAEAEGHLRPLEASHGDCGGVALGLARLRAAGGDAAEAERLFERATSLTPADAAAHGLFAQYWLSRGQRARADYESSLALSLDPDCPEALVVAGQILGLKGQAAAAFQTLQKAARLGPGYAEAQFQLGVVLFRRNLHAEAVRLFEKAAALRPTDARARDYLALGHEALGEAEHAEEAYQGALRVNEKGPFFDPLLDYNYGRFLLKEGRLDESRSHLDRATSLLPLSRGVRYERGKLNLTVGRYQAAREDAERALSLPDPGGLVLDLQVYYLLATVYARLGETDLARKYAELSRTTKLPDQD
jgi:tetratricopeptide (TPR) repeat protein